MSYYTINKIEVSSVFKMYTAMVAVVMALIGLVVFFLSALLPIGIELNMNVGGRILWFVLFVIINTIIISALILCAVCVYNWIAKKTGKGVAILLEPKE